MSDFLRFKEETQEVTVNEEAYNLKLIRELRERNSLRNIELEANNR